MSNDEQSESLAQQAAAWVPPWERQQRPPDRAYQAAAEAEARAAAGERDSAGAGEEDADGTERDFAGAGEGDADPAERDFAAAEELAAADDLVDDDETVVDEISADASDDAEKQPDDEEVRSGAGFSDDDDYDEAFEGTNPPGYYSSPEESAPGEVGDESDDDEGDFAGGVPEVAALGGPEDELVSVDQPLEVGEEEPEPSAGEVGPELPLPEAIEEAAEESGDEDRQPADAPLPVDGDDAGDVFDQAADDDVSDDGADDLPFGDGDDAAGEGADELGPSSTQPPAGGLDGVGPAANAVPEQGGRRKSPVAVVEGAGSRTDDDLPELADEGELAAALEAILLVVDEPVAEMQLAQILEQPTERVAAMLEDISARYTAAGHGFDLRRAAGGWRLYTRPEYAAYVERFVLDGQSVRLTQAALETLAVVAYKQPVTRSRISAIRGVNCDGVMRTLVTRGLIEECGIEGETGAHLYRTTPLFLEKLGLNSVDQLPPLAPFLPDDVEEVLDAPG